MTRTERKQGYNPGFLLPFQVIFRALAHALPMSQMIQIFTATRRFSECGRKDPFNGFVDIYGGERILF